MTPTPLLGLLLALAALALASILGWVLVAIVALGYRWRTGARLCLPAPLLAQLRLLPLALSIVVVSVQVAAFIRYEAGGAETAGPLLLALSALGAAFLVEALRSALRSWRDTRAVVGSWRSTAVPLCVPTWSRRAWAIKRRFPIVAVVGIARPQLFVARQVATGCTDRELAAIAAHEAAHVAAQDNLIRLLFELTPGARLFSRLAAPLEQSWMIASEEAADMTARHSASDLDLASALTKVARMAVGCAPDAVAVSGLIGGAELASRVQRLCDGSTPTRQRGFIWIPAAALLVTLIAASVNPRVLSSVHELFEVLVRR